MMKERKNNKGFTLVEMIIVIAVMAILGVVAAPQFLKYVETSRQETDRGAIWEVARAAQIAYATTEDIGDTIVLVSIDENGNAKYGEISLSGDSLNINEIMDSPTYKAIVNGLGITTDFDIYSNVILDAEVNEVMPEDSYQYKSDLYRNSEITIEIIDDGNIKIAADGAAVNNLQAVHAVDGAVLSGYQNAVSTYITTKGLEFTTIQEALPTIEADYYKSEEDSKAELTAYARTLRTKANEYGTYKDASYYTEEAIAARFAATTAENAVSKWGWSTTWRTLRDSRTAAYNAATEGAKLEKSYNEDEKALTNKTASSTNLTIHINAVK